MLKSFYKYLVDELITDYFTTHKPGSFGLKYFYVLFENAEHRNGLYNAIAENLTAHDITVTGIFENRQEWMDVDVLNTKCFQPNADGAEIIVGNESVIDNGYLTTLRNAVVQPDSQYSDKTLFCILCNNKLESLTSTGVNLLAEGGPLHQDTIFKNMLTQLDNLTILDYDRMCLKRYAETIRERIAHHEADLFMFKDILGVLQSHPVELSGKYDKFGYFPDKYCTTPSLITIDSKDMEARIKGNSYHFEQIKTILNSYSTEAYTELIKIYDNALANKIVKNPDTWMQIDYEEIKKSVEKKAEQANYKFVSLQIANDHSAELINSPLPKMTQKSKKVFAIICDNTDHITTSVRIDFNKPISDCTVLKDINVKGNPTTQYKVVGSSVRIELADNAVKCEIGKDSNKFTFIMMRVKAPHGTFEEIKPYFSISSKANIVIKTPEDIDSISIGRGSKKIDFTNTLGDIEWDDDYSVKVDLNDFCDGVDLPITFGDKKIIFKIEVDEQRIVPVKPPKLIGEVWSNGTSAKFPGGNKVRVGSNEYNADKEFFSYLELERKMATENIYCMKRCLTSFDSKLEPVELQLPTLVKEKIDAIYVYYSEKGYVPTLSYIDDELFKLYEEYVDAVHNVIMSITPNELMDEKEYSLTKLGTIEDGDKVMLTPYHPLLIAYMMEYKNRYKGQMFENPKILKLVSPFYLMPYMSYENSDRQPYCDEFTDDLKTWLFYEKASNAQQVRTYNITTKMVTSKIKEFKKHFSYLFQVADSPIIISTIGIYDDTNVVKGLFEYVKSEMKNSPEAIQRVEVHEYVKNLAVETFFEKLNRLNSEELICKELDKVDTYLDMGNKDISPLQIIRQFFTRIDFYKHDINECNNEIDYCHISFYQMDTGLEFSKSPTSALRSELSLNGLISIPSTNNQKGKTYTVGFGTRGFATDLSKYGKVYPIAIDMNSLYANESTHWANSYSPDTCFAKSYVFKDDLLLQSIYDKSNWVTFLNPEVDIDFFYRQKDLYVIHYTDQYTINAKYDSITVTRQTKQYDNMLAGYYDSCVTNTNQRELFMSTMMNYFNSLNGSWLLDVIRKTDVQIREKMSIVSACIMMKRFLSRNQNVVWVPISLEEILRVTGNIGLEQDSLFSKKALGVKGQMSDDLLLVGVEDVQGAIKLYYYPVEVKASIGSNFTHTASEQVVKTYNVLKKTLMDEGGFANDIYKTFFASQILTNTDKLWANGLLDEAEYQFIDNCRFRLLNLDYTIADEMKCREMGYAATVAFSGSSAPEASVDMINDDILVCHIEVSLNTCNSCIISDDVSAINQLIQSPIIVADEVKAFWKNKDLGILDSPTTMPSGTIPVKSFENQNSSAQAQDIDITETKDQHSTSSNVAKISSDTQEGEQTTDEIIEVNSPDSEISSNQPIQIIVGYSKVTRENILFEPNNTRMVSHPNMGIIGTMGTGKTQFARSVIAQFAKESVHNVGGKPVGMLVFDYKGDYKDKEFLDAVGGTSYKFNYPFNPLKLVVNDEVEGMNLPAITADRIADSFAKAYGLGLKQQSNIKQVIIDTYNDAGITRDSNTWDKPVPTMEQVIDKYFETYDANDKAYALFDKLQDYTIFTTDNSNCVSLFEWLNSVRVIDLTLYPDDTKKVIVSLILDLFYAEMRQLGGSKQEDGYRELRAMIMVDEAHQFLKKDFNSFRSIISEGRMFGVGMILSTQNISDFKTAQEDYSQFILSWVIHHVNSISKAEIASIFGASDPNGERYMDFINKAKLFESVCKIGSKVDGIRDLPFFELVQKDDRFKNDN